MTLKKIVCRINIGNITSWDKNVKINSQCAYAEYYLSHAPHYN